MATDREPAEGSTSETNSRLELVTRVSDRAKTWNGYPILRRLSATKFKTTSQIPWPCNSWANAKASREEGHSEVNCELEARSRRS